MQRGGQQADEETVACPAVYTARGYCQDPGGAEGVEPVIDEEEDRI